MKKVLQWKVKEGTHKGQTNPYFEIYSDTNRLYIKGANGFTPITPIFSDEQEAINFFIVGFNFASLHYVIEKV